MWVHVLREVGWETQLVDHVEFHEDIYPRDNRFSKVFTKLRCLELTQYNRVLLMDSDLIVRENPDTLFNRPAPAACRRHPRGDHGDGLEINGKDFFNHNRKQTGGINAGVVLLEPSAEDARRAFDELQSGIIPGPIPLNAPEQDYLTRFYMHKWKNLDITWNYQLHQIAFCARPGNEHCVRADLGYEHIKIIHFSSAIKPRDYLVDVKYNNVTRQEFIAGTLVAQNMEFLERVKKEEEVSVCSEQRQSTEPQRIWKFSSRRRWASHQELHRSQRGGSAPLWA